MALETGTYINDLVVTNPPGSDAKSTADDHLRLTKTVLKNSIVGFTGAVLVTGADGGAADAYTVTPASALAAYTTKMIVEFTPTNTNTGASTINISGLGVKSIKSVSGAALAAGELTASLVYTAAYNGTEFRLLSVTKNYADGLAFSASLPSQAGNSGKYITTDGTTASWATVAIPAGDTPQTLTDGATVNWNMSSGTIGTLTLGGNRTMAAPTNLTTKTYILVLNQDATGSRTVTWNAVFKWAAGSAPALSIAPNAKDVFSFFSDGTNLYGSYLRGMA
jgi:hypothetical protein